MDMLAGLSVLQLFLVVSMYRINAKTGLEVCNFEVGARFGVRPLLSLLRSRSSLKESGKPPLFNPPCPPAP